jgi:hypothetical protein
MIGRENNEGEMQKSISGDLKGVKDVYKKTIMDWIEQKIDESNQKLVTIPRIRLRHHRMADRGLGKYIGNLMKQARWLTHYISIVG